MMLQHKPNFYNPAEFQGVTVLGTTPKAWDIPNHNPLEELLIVVHASFTTTSGNLTTGTLTDGLLGLVKRCVVEINDGVRPRSCVDFSGIGLVEFASQTGLNLDRATLDSWMASGSGVAGTTIGSSPQTFRVTYRVPFVHPMITEPLRTRMLLPCHTWTQQPKLKIEFGSLAEIVAGTGIACSALAVDVVLRPRKMSDQMTQQILSKGGFIDSDLLESTFSIPVSSTAEVRHVIAGPGSLSGILFRHYRGGSSITRAPIDLSSTAGAETKWVLEQAKGQIAEWRWKHLQIINDLSRVANGQNQTYSPNFAGAVASGVQPASSCYLDLLTDGLDSANELGSLIELPTDPARRVELVGFPASVTTNASVIYVGCHRLFGNITPWIAQGTGPAK